MKHYYIKFNILYLFSFLFVCVLFLGCPAQGSSSGGSSDNTEETGFKRTVDSDGDVGVYTFIAVDGSNVYISYSDVSNEDLKFAKSIDGGNTWDPGNLKTVDSTGSVGWNTSIAADGLNVYISYHDYTNRDLKFAKSTDGGNTWDAGNIKTVDSAGNVGEYTTSIATDGSNVYISYYDYTNRDLKFAKSTDGGNTWDAGNIKTVDSAGNVGEYTSIAVDGSNVYISYWDVTNGDLKFAKSIDGGNTWDAGNIKTVDSGGEVGTDTSIAVDGSNVYISYSDVTNEDLKFAKSTDGGNTWDAGNIKTVDSGGEVGTDTSIAVDDSNVYISYYDYTNGDLKFIKSIDNGNTW